MPSKTLLTRIVVACLFAFVGADTAHAYYAPQSGRFISRDPIMYPDGANTYAAWYVPANVDPMGMNHGTPGAGTPLPPSGLREHNCRIFNHWFNNEPDPTWTKDLPKCPCSFQKSTICGESRYLQVPDFPTIDANPNKYGNFHPNASVCIRSSPNEAGQGEQCCYDSSGSLITSGLSGGTSDRVSPGEGLFNSLFNVIGHLNKDVYPFEWAMMCDGGTPGECMKRYWKKRPVNNKSGCKPNPS